jgi:hypothetical protein
LVAIGKGTLGVFVAKDSGAVEAGRLQEATNKEIKIIVSVTSIIFFINELLEPNF